MDRSLIGNCHQKEKTNIPHAYLVGNECRLEFTNLVHLGLKPARQKLTPDTHSSHDLNWSEAKRFRSKLTDLNIPEVDLVTICFDLLEAEHLKSKDLANEHPTFMPADVAAVVDSPKFKSLRIDVLN